MASLYKLPCIFVVENNLWAIGMQHNRATNPTAGDDSPYIYKKGPAFGMPGILVDGMDVRKVTLTGHGCQLLFRNVPDRVWERFTRWTLCRLWHMILFVECPAGYPRPASSNLPSLEMCSHARTA